MSFDNRIQELVRANLADNHNVEGVGFIDELLLLATETGEIRCSLASEGELRFQAPNQAPCNVALERAKSKLRLLCARLAALCAANHRDEVSPYGGEGMIVRAAPVRAKLRRAAMSVPGGTSSAGDQSGSNGINPRPDIRWVVRFKNTPADQEFIIQVQ